MAGKKATHRVTCSVCGKKGNVEVREGGRIADKKWNFFGRFVVELEATKYLAHENAMGEEMAAGLGDQQARHVEYWECEDCFRENEQILKSGR